MPQPRIKMRKIRETLRLRHESGLSIRQISASTKAGVGTIQNLLHKAKELDLSWPLPDELDDHRVAQLFYPEAPPDEDSRRLVVPDWTQIHQELKRRAMTKHLLWEEYCEVHPTRCYSYSQFCDLYAKWRKKQKRSMRQLHKAGEKTFVDYAGMTIPVIDSRTGEILFDAQVFVGVLGASNFTYAEATRSQACRLAAESRAYV